MKLFNSTLNTESKKHREMRLAGLLPKKLYKLAKSSKKATSEWNKARKECLERYGHKCVLCGSENDLQVHHIILRTLEQKLKYEQNNLCVLCSKCHNHSGYDKNYILLTKKLIRIGLGDVYKLDIDEQTQRVIYKI